MAVTEDARNSLTAAITVTLFFGAGYFALQLLKTVELPRWVPIAGFALNTLTLAWQLRGATRRRRQAVGSDS